MEFNNFEPLHLGTMGTLLVVHVVDKLLCDGLLQRVWLCATKVTLLA